MTADIIIASALSVLAILLVLVEIFLLPGVTIAGIAGGIFGIGSVMYAFSYLGSTAGIITLCFNLVAFAVLFVWLIKSKAINKIGLHTEIDSKVVSDTDKVAVGDTGVTLSRLNPMGKIEVNEVTVEGKSLGDFIDEGVEVTVIKVYPNQIIVRVKNDNNN